MSHSPSITFYDIASGPPVRCFAPNPWKTRYDAITYLGPTPISCPCCPTTVPILRLSSREIHRDPHSNHVCRYALNFKRVHGSGLQYTTTWVPLPEVGSVRASLGAAPVRKHAVDGGDFPTLPVIVDRTTAAAAAAAASSSSSDGKEAAAGGVVVGDSFDIALHLDRAHPTDPPLLPAGTVGLHRAFNAHADRVFTAHVALAAHGMPLDPATAKVTQDEFCRRAGRPPGCWEELVPHGAARAEMLASFEGALGELAALWTARGGGEQGKGASSSSSPFLEGGKVPMYADLIVGAWLQMMRVCLPEWETLRGWNGGLWGRLNDALERYAQAD